MLRQQHDALETKFASQEDGHGDWFKEVRPLTPTKATAIKALELRGADTTGNFEVLKTRLDLLCENVLLAGEEGGAELVSTLDDALVLDQFRCGGDQNRGR